MKDFLKAYYESLLKKKQRHLDVELTLSSHMIVDKNVYIS